MNFLSSKNKNRTNIFRKSESFFVLKVNLSEMTFTFPFLIKKKKKDHNYLCFRLFKQDWWEPSAQTELKTCDNPVQQFFSSVKCFLMTEVTHFMLNSWLKPACSRTYIYNASGFSVGRRPI